MYNINYIYKKNKIQFPEYKLQPKYKVLINSQLALVKNPHLSFTYHSLNRYLLRTYYVLVTLSRAKFLIMPLF